MEVDISKRIKMQAPKKHLKYLNKGVRFLSVGIFTFVLSSCNSSIHQKVDPKPGHFPKQRESGVGKMVKPFGFGLKQYPYIDYAVQPLIFNQWLLTSDWRQHQANAYAAFLNSRTGYLPPLEQILRSARSWEVCGFDPYGIPPVAYWSNMVPTLKLVNHLQSKGVLSKDIEVVSTYRDPELNTCAKGSSGSKHLINAAVDISIDYADEFERLITEQELCKFWINEGEFYNFGLGLYKSGAIHIDTQGYRTWGSSYGSGSSPCQAQ